MGPIQLSPFYVSPIWGGTAIAEARGLEHTAEKNLGESFDVSAHPNFCTTVASGPEAGKRLDAFLADHRDEVMGGLSDDTVLQVVHMDARDNLSVQVHPGEEDAQRLRGDHGKTETWYVLSAKPDATLIGGSTTTDVEALRDAASRDTIGDDFGKRFKVSEGDVVHVPAGTMHALGAGILAVEVGSFGGTTLRIADWGRGRDLDVEEAFEVLRPEQEVSITHLGAYDPTSGPKATPVVEDGPYRIRVVDVDQSASFEPDDRYHILTCVAGTGEVVCAEGRADLSPTLSVVIPASAGSFEIRGNCRIIQSFRPLGE